MIRLALSMFATSALAADPEVPDAAAAEEVVVEEAGPVTYTLEPAASWLYVVVYNDPAGLASRFGHDHGIKATEFSGTVVWGGDAANCSVKIDVPVSGLQPDPAGMRERAGIDPDGAVGEGSLKTIRANFLKKSQLFADSFATISYEATSCSGVEGTVDVAGTLTIRGTAKQVKVPMQVTADGSTFKASGTFSATHEDFGFKPFTNLGGALRNKTDLKFVVNVVGKAS